MSCLSQNDENNFTESLNVVCGFTVSLCSCSLLPCSSLCSLSEVARTELQPKVSAPHKLFPKRWYCHPPQPEIFELPGTGTIDLHFVLRLARTRRCACSLLKSVLKVLLFQPMQAGRPFDGQQFPTACCSLQEQQIQVYLVFGDKVLAGPGATTPVPTLNPWGFFFQLALFAPPVQFFHFKVFGLPNCTKNWTLLTSILDQQQLGLTVQTKVRRVSESTLLRWQW